MSRAADRFEPVEGRPLVPLPPFRLEERVVETLVPGEAPTWVVVPAFDEAAVDPGDPRGARGADAAPAGRVRRRQREPRRHGRASSAPGPRASHRAARGLGVRLVHEPEKGTGAAADTGMRLAIAAGATLPAPHRRRQPAASGLGGADGRSACDGGRGARRRPDGRRARTRRSGVGVRALLKVVMTASGALSVPKNRGRGYRTRFRMLVGSNVGIRAETYVAAGGFPRCRIDEVHDDRALMNRTRRVTDRIVSDHAAVVETSARRYRRVRAARRARLVPAPRDARGDRSMSADLQPSRLAAPDPPSRGPCRGAAQAGRAAGGMVGGAAVAVRLAAGVRRVAAGRAAAGSCGSGGSGRSSTTRSSGGGS